MGTQVGRPEWDEAGDQSGQRGGGELTDAEQDEIVKCEGGNQCVPVLVTE